jgi:hypothetical protein
VSDADPPRCSDASRAAGEPLAGTAVTATSWLLVEVPGGWPRDVSDAVALPADARDAVSSWLTRKQPSRLLFVRRPGRAADRLLAFAVRAEEAAAEVRRFELESPDELGSADLDAGGDPVQAPLVLVCGHGSRDRCCALRGGSVFAALAPGLDDEVLWLSSHQGGHRFAGNVLVLPSGIQLGRIDAEDAVALTAKALDGRIELDRYRGRTCFEQPVQAAEHALRVELGLDDVAALRFVAADGREVRIRTADGVEHTVVVEETEGPSVPASCGADPEPQRMFEVRLS